MTKVYRKELIICTTILYTSTIHSKLVGNLVLEHSGSKVTEIVTTYRGSPTSTVSTSTNSTSTNFSAIGIKFELVELLCSKIRTSGNWLCSTH